MGEDGGVGGSDGVGAQSEGGIHECTARRLQIFPPLSMTVGSTGRAGLTPAAGSRVLWLIGLRSTSSWIAAQR